MISFKDFIKEAAKIVGYKNLGKNVTVTTFEPRKKKAKSFKPPNKIDKNDPSVQKGIVFINKIASKYNSYVEQHTIEDHIVDRFIRPKGRADRDYNMNDITTLFTGIEKNSKFFSDLGKIANKGGNDENRKVNLVDTTNEVHVVVHVTKKGKRYQIVARTLLGNFTRKYIGDEKKKGIPVYYTR